MHCASFQRSILFEVVPEVRFAIWFCAMTLPFFNVTNKLKVINSFQVAHVFCFSKYSVLYG